MAGMVISQVAEAHPGKISHLVYLCAYLPADGQSLFDLIAANREAGPPVAIEKAMQLSPDKRTCTIRPEQIQALFYNRCPPAIATALPREFPPQATLPLAGKVRLSDENFGSVYKTYLCCLDDQVIPVRQQRQMLSRQPCTEMIQLDADHSPFLSCPETLAAVLHGVSLGGKSQGT